MSRNIWSYPHARNLGHPEIRDLLEGKVLVQEKYDGSQFSFGVLDGELKMRSRGQVIDIDNPPKLFAPAVQTVREREGGLRPNAVYRAEAICSRRHNTLTYSRTPLGELIIFDIEVAPDEFLWPGDVEEEADNLELESAANYYLGEGFRVTQEFIETYLEDESSLGGPKIEGVVIKNYQRFGPGGKILVGKHVSEAFKEIHPASWKAANPGAKDIIAGLVDALRTEARWSKAVTHLREAGALEGTPRDIGALIKEVQKDVEDEAAEEIAAKLTAWAMPKIRKGVAAGVAEWYKKQLMEVQFEQPSGDSPARADSSDSGGVMADALSGGGRVVEEITAT